MTRLLLARGPTPEPGECVGCPLAENGVPKDPVRGCGSPNPRFILIGEGPGRNEVRKGMPFVGESGYLLEKAFKKLNLRREEVYITNTTLCYPRVPSAEKDRVVSKAAEHCRKRLEKELSDWPDKPLLLLGKHASQAFLGNQFKITELAGSYHEVDGRAVIPTLHPAAMLHGNSESGKGHSAGLAMWYLVHDILKIKELADGEAKPLELNIKLIRNRSEADRELRKLVSEIKKLGRFACDVETVGVQEGECANCMQCDGHSAKEPRHARLRVIGIATEKRSVSFDYDAITDYGFSLLFELFSTPTLTVIFHNAAYDRIVLECHGYEFLCKIEDTQHLHHNAFPGAEHRLQRVVTQFLLLPPWKSEFKKEHGPAKKKPKKGEEPNSAVEFRELQKYNAVDTFGTACVEPILQAYVKHTRTDRTYESDMRMTEVANLMHHQGIPIDLEVNRELREYLSPIVAKAQEEVISRIEDPEARKRFFEVWSIEAAKKKRKKDADEFVLRAAQRKEEFEDDFDGVNLGSRHQVVALLKACGVPLRGVTASGGISTKKDYLEELRKNPVVGSLLTFREHKQILGTFVLPLPYELDHDQRTHVQWPINKITGRWGSKRAFQNWSKGYQTWPCKCGHLSKDHGHAGCDVRRCQCRKLELIKKSFENWLGLPYEHKGMPNLRWQVRPKKGRILVGGDFAQLEARVVALLSQEPYLLKAFLEGVDIHSEFAKEIFPHFKDLVPKSPEWVALRDPTKNAEYGFLYGGSEMTVWMTFAREGKDVPLQTINKMFETFRKRMPNVTQYYERLIGDVMMKGEVRSFLMGRRQAFPLGNPEPTVIKNYVCQAGGADIMNTGLWKFYQAVKGKDVQILIQGHDAVTAECKEDKAEWVKETMKDCLEQEHELNGVTMKFPIEADIGPSWAET